MKKMILAVMTILSVSTSVFASSACIMSVGSVAGEETEVVCDGKKIGSFSTDNNYLGAITLEIKKLTDQGYSLKAVIAPGVDPNPQYIFVK